MYSRLVTKPTMVLPPVYELSINMWRWCKLSEVCNLVPQIAELAGKDYAPTPEELVSEFAPLIRRNLPLQDLPEKEKKMRRPRIFRYSRDGKGFNGTEVPDDYSQKACRDIPFRLELRRPYPKRLYVREDWAMDVVMAIRLGVIGVFEDREGVVVGRVSAGKGQEYGRLIDLTGDYGALAKMNRRR